MDQIKIGKFIAALRKEKCLTQEQLGENLGVTNKTISRWENGNYMPDVERRRADELVRYLTARRLFCYQYIFGSTAHQIKKRCFGGLLCHAQTKIV